MRSQSLEGIGRHSALPLVALDDKHRGQTPHQIVRNLPTPLPTLPPSLMTTIQLTPETPADSGCAINIALNLNATAAVATAATAATPLICIVLSGDLILHTPSHRFLVSASVLRNASKEFSRLLLLTSAATSITIPDIAWSDSDSATAALILLLRIIHKTYSPSPPGTPPPPVSVLSALAGFAYRYNVTSAISSKVTAWANQHRFKTASDWLAWVQVGRIFQRVSVFCAAARTGVIGSTESELAAYTPMLGRAVVRDLLAHRAKLLNAVISDTSVFLKQRAHTTREYSLHRLCIADARECEIAILGGLLRGLTEIGLFPTPGVPYKGLRVRDVLKGLEGMECVGPLGTHNDCKEAVEVMWAGLVKGIRGRVWGIPVERNWGNAGTRRRRSTAGGGEEKENNPRLSMMTPPESPDSPGLGVWKEGTRGVPFTPKKMVKLEGLSLFPTPAEAKRSGLWDKTSLSPIEKGKGSEIGKMHK